MISLIRLYFQNDTSVISDQLSIDFHPRLTLGLYKCNYISVLLYNTVSDTRGGIIFSFRVSTTMRYSTYSC